MESSMNNNYAEGLKQRDVQRKTDITEGDKGQSVDGVLDIIGSKGNFHTKVIWLMAVLQMCNATQDMLMIFIGATPDFRCDEYPESVSPCESECNISFSGNDFTSIVSEWSLVCEESYKPSAAQSIYMAGLMISSLVFASYADSHGRHLVTSMCLIAMAFFSFLSVAAPSYSIFTVLRFLIGFASSGWVQVSFVLTMELVDTKSRDFAGFLFPTMYGLGIACLAITAKFVRSWKMLTMIISLPALMGIYLYRFLPESPGWLVCQNQHQKAEVILLRIAHENGHNHLNPRDIQLKVDSDKLASSKSGATSILFSKDVIFKLLGCMLLYFIIPLVYIGLTANAGSSGGDVYTAVALSGLVEIPAYILTVPLISWFGKKHCILITLVLTAISCLLCLIVPSDLGFLGMALLLLGKLSISAGYGVIAMYVTTIFSPVVRNNAFGICMMMSRMAGIFSPLTTTFLVGGHLLCFYSSLCVIGGLALLVLPEDVNRNMSHKVE